MCLTATSPCSFQPKTSEEQSPRFQRLKRAFEDQMTEVYLLFYNHVLQYFVRFNLFLQREEPIIGVLQEQVYIYACYETMLLCNTCMYVPRIHLLMTAAVHTLTVHMMVIYGM